MNQEATGKTYLDVEDLQVYQAFECSMASKSRLNGTSPRVNAVGPFLRPTTSIASRIPNTEH